MEERQRRVGKWAEKGTEWKGEGERSEGELQCLQAENDPATFLLLLLLFCVRKRPVFMCSKRAAAALYHCTSRIAFTFLWKYRQSLLFNLDLKSTRKSWTMKYAEFISSLILHHYSNLHNVSLRKIMKLLINIQKRMGMKSRVSISLSFSILNINYS